MCFLDASKAFDRVSHTVLFKNYLNGVPGYIVRILVFWYETQQMCVRWGSHVSDHIDVSNGVRQGVILFPYLFSVYIHIL